MKTKTQLFKNLLLLMILVWSVPSTVQANIWGWITMNVGDTRRLEVSESTKSILRQCTIESYEWYSADWTQVQVTGSEWWVCDIKALRATESVKLTFTCKYRQPGLDYTQRMEHCYYIEVKENVEPIEPTSIDLNYTSVSLEVGGTKQLTATVNPNGASQSVNWSVVSGSSVASVSSSGLVTAKAAGTAKIRATSSVKSSVYKECTVTVNPNIVYPTGISLPASRSVDAGKTITLTPTLTPSNATTTLTWKSSNTSIATVTSSGVVKGVSPGTATITVTTSNGHSASCEVTVNPVEPTDISLPASETIDGGSTITLTPTITPSNATTTLTWSSSAEDVASVSSSGSSGVVKGISPGTATITVTTSNGKSASCEVTVNSVELTDISLPDEESVVEGQSVTLTPTKTPSNATTPLTWTSTNTSVATVSSSGVVKGIKSGTASIIVITSNGLAASCTITVRPELIDISLPTEESVHVGDSITLTPTLTPSNALTTLQWGSTNASVATVSSSGVVKGIKEGKTTIIVISSNGKSAFCEVTVLPPQPSSISLPSAETIYEGDSVTLTPTINPSDAMTTLTWTSSRTSVATVSSSGIVKGISPGTATITVTTSNGKSASCEVMVKPVIQFADAKVKTLCVGKWDADGDGKLSEEEAAAVTSLEEVFKGNKEITSFEELKHFTGLTSIDDYAFSNCTSLTSITIPNSVTSIGDYTFFGCDGLTSITIPNSVTSIGDSAFSGCAGLTSITVEEGNTKYDSRDNCNAIIETATNTLIAGCQNTIIPNSVTSIGKSAFYGCSGLNSINLPKSVSSIGSNAFTNCAGLTSITIEEGNTKYDSRDNCNAIIETATNKLIAGCQNTIIPNSVTNIGNYAFCGCTGLTSINIPNNVTSIGDFAFCDCTGLTSITIPNSVTSIGSNAFVSCRSLTSVTIGNSVTSIGIYAFDYCSSLISVTLKRKMPVTLEGYTFSNRRNATLYVPVGSKSAYEAADYWKDFKEIVEKDDSNIIQFADAKVKALCVANWDINGDGELSEDEAAAVTSLGEVFSQNKEITSFNELQYFTGLTSISDLAFSCCFILTSITIPNSVTSIGIDAFNGCI